MTVKLTCVRSNTKFCYIFCALNCHIFGRKRLHNMYQQNHYPCYVKLETNLTFKIAVIYVLVKLQEKQRQNS